MSLIQPMILLALLAQAKPPEPEVKTLRVSPAALPSPLLKYRLLPLESELRPGDAAPMYLRINGEMTATAPDLAKKPPEWLALPLDKFPKDEARKLVDALASRIRQIEYAANRQTCTWNYSLPEERARAIEILLPDVQQLRSWLRLLAVKARLEVAEKRYDDALKTIQTGQAMSRHVARGPFLINGLVGIATARDQLSVLDELLDQPDAPNLYWALTSLPRPMIDLRDAFAVESRTILWLFPDLDDLDAKRPEAEWSAKLSRFHGQLLEWTRRDQVPGPDGKPLPIPSELATLDAFRAWAGPLARALAASRFKGAADVPGDDQAILLYVSDQYFQYYDQVFAATYLPFPDSSAIVAESNRRFEAMKKTPLMFFSNYAPNISAGLLASVRLDLKIAALRTVEAIRLHASGTGKLPGTLDEIKAVPVPRNPATGRPFEYRLEGDTAVLHGPVPDGKAAFSLTYRIQLR